MISHKFQFNAEDSCCVSVESERRVAKAEKLHAQRRDSVQRGHLSATLRTSAIPAGSSPCVVLICSIGLMNAMY